MSDFAKGFATAVVVGTVLNAASKILLKRYYKKKLDKAVEEFNATMKDIGAQSAN